MYTCKSPFEFAVDLMCAGDATLKLLSLKSREERQGMTLKDISHNHQLKLLRVRSRQIDDDYSDEDDDATIKNICKACLQPIIDTTYYVCTLELEGCKDVFLHKFCAELPVEMKHPFHPLHPLTVMLSPPLEHFKCSACGKFCQGHIYSCRRCSFQLDIICATTSRRLLEHKCHQHPLTLLPLSNSSLFCSACRKVHEGMFYQCNTCVVVFIHERCASLAYIIYHPSHEGHPLRLGYYSDSCKKRNICDICYQIIYDNSGWFYYCWECKFYGHLNCIKPDKVQEVQEIDPKIPVLPWEEADNEFGTVGLLNLDLMSIPNDDDKGNDIERINHFSHPDHPLILQMDVPRVTNPYSDGDITLTVQCNGCCKQISAPLYSCAGCHFYIHKGCALLPNSIVQPHGHSKHKSCRLLLVKEPWYETRVFNCYVCKEDCNGFYYQCEEKPSICKIDVECAFLPAKIVHKSHPFHPLDLVDLDEFNFKENRVKCCSGPNPKYQYRCDTCGFLIHTRCAMFPSKSHHRFDSDSPFILCFNPRNIEPNQYHYCDICENELDPKKWFYFSSKWGAQTMHPQCLLQKCKAGFVNPNFKSISDIIIGDIHPHPLQLYPSGDYRKCYQCGVAIEDHKNNTSTKQPLYFSYQCVERNCIYEIHVRCAYKHFLEAEDQSQDYFDTGIRTVASNFQQLYLKGRGKNHRTRRTSGYS